MRSASLVAALLCLRIASADSALTLQSAWFLDDSVAPLVKGPWVAPVPNPVTLALRDLKMDWYKVIGTSPVLTTTAAPLRWDGDTIVIFKLDSSLPAESFTVVAGVGGAAPTLTVTGGDTRGLIYGIYHVSSDFLGVDPFWWWNDAPPAPEPTGVAVSPAYAYSSGAPAILSRGGFNNDEDLSGYFAASPLGDAVYNVAWADRFCETLLRLRANTIIPSTFAFVDEAPYRVAAARGLKLGNHHVMPVGNNVFAWPKGVSYAYRLSPGPFHAVWQALADYQQAQQGREMVYSLGYRGVNDEPFWNQDVGCTTDACRGATISQAIANQSAIVLGTAGPLPPQRVAYAWMELLELKEAGTLVLPPGTSWVWTDFPGAFLFEGGFDNVTSGDGFYAHVQMMNGEAGQLVEFIPPARIFANVWQFWSRNATAYGMINLSDLKFVPLTAEAVFAYMWSPAAFNASARCLAASAAAPGAAAARDAATGRRGHLGVWPAPAAGARGCTAADFGGVTPAQAQDAFIAAFSARHYGAAAGAAAAPLYSSYFNISYMAQAQPGVATKADHYLGSTLRTLLAAFSAAVAAGNKSASLRTLAAADAAFAAGSLAGVDALYHGAVLPLGASLPPGSAAARFFAAHLAAQTAVHWGHLAALAQAAAGAQAWLAGDGAGAAAAVGAALAAVDEMRGALRAGEGSGAWAGSYAADGWTWVWGSRAALARLAGALAGRTALPPLPDNPYPDYAFMTYSTGGAGANDPVAMPTFPFAAFNASTAFDVAPRLACAADVPPAAAAAAGAAATVAAAAAAADCSSTWSGVTVGPAGAEVGLFVAAYMGAGARAPHVMRYTIDGSPVSGASALYTAPFAVQAPATVRARSFDVATGAALSVETSADVRAA